MNQLSHLPRHIHDELIEIVRIICEITIPSKVILPRNLAKGKSVEDGYVNEGTAYS